MSPVTLIQLTDDLKTLYIKTAEKLKGSDRRQFMAEVVKGFGMGGQTDTCLGRCLFSFLKRQNVYWAIILASSAMDFTIIYQPLALLPQVPSISLKDL